MLALFKKINPLAEVGEEKRVYFLIRKLLAFLGIYFITSVIAETLIIMGFAIAGYNLLNGEIPEGVFIQTLLPLYGFLLFSVNTILYCKIIEKKSLSDIGIFINIKSLADLVKGMFVSGIVLFITFIIMCSLNIYDFIGFTPFRFKWLIIYFIAFLIQATTEEIMCRGFLMNTLHEKFSKIFSIIISSIAFILPHIASLPNGIYGTISVVNLFLVSFFFSILFFQYGTISICAGFHTGWNFIVSYLCKLQLSGMSATEGIFNLKAISSNPLLTGGEYGIEASCIVTVTLLIINLTSLRKIKRKAKNGIS